MDERFSGNHFDKSIIDILIDLKPYDDMTAVVCERDILMSSPPVQLFATHCWERRCYDCLPFTLSSCSSHPVTFGHSLPLDVIDVGLPSSYPKCVLYA